MRGVGLAGVALWALAGGLARAAPALEEYGRLPAFDQMQISPAGDRIAFIATDGEDRKLVVRKAGVTATVAVVDAGNLKVRRLSWLDETHILIESSAAINVDPAAPAGKGEFTQSSVYDLKTNKAFNVFGGETKILRTTYGFYGLVHEGRHTFAYFGGLPLSGSGNSFVDFDRASGYISASHIDLYKIDADGGHPEIAAEGNDRYGSDWVVGPQGTIVAHAESDPRTGEWRLYDDPDDRDLIERLANPLGDTSLLGLGRTPDSYLVHQGDGAGNWTIMEFTAGHAAGAPLLGGRPVRRPITDPTTGLLIGAVTNEDEPSTILFDQTLQARFDKVKRAFPGEIAELVSATSDLGKMVVLTTGPRDSGTYFLIDVTAGTAQAVGWRYPGVLPADVGASRIVAYKAADGLAMQGVLTLPPGKAAKDLPVVVLPHGGPDARDYLGFDWWAQAFASRGYAVFQPNFRGSDGFGKAFRDAGLGQWGRKMQTDISDGVGELARQGIVDPKRACIVGASYGGYAALAGVTVQQGLYRCAVSVAGVADLSSFLVWRREKFGEVNEVTRWDDAFLGVRSAGDPILREISPAKLAARADAPILLIHGKDDTVVPLTQSLAMRDALQSAHKSVDLVELQSEDHWLSRSQTRNQMLAAAVAFVEKYDPAN
ncbi:MAG: alpha/beta hydrolase family protein [Caulobacteraceae bacterium]